MAGGKDVTVRAQALDGTWQTIGGDRARGLYPENVVLEADSWGSSRAAFNLRRDPTSFWPELSAFTPVEFEVGSSLVWSGRIKETPSQVAQRVMNVQCEGWQYHLDDDIYNRTYVHTNLSEWKDARSFIDIDLTKATQAGQVSTDGGIMLGYQNAAVLAAGNPYVGVVLDLGPSNRAARVSFDWQSAANQSRLTVWAKGTDSLSGLLASSENLLSFGAASASSGTSSNTFSLGTYRYVAIILQENTGAALTLPADTWVKITGMRVFTDAAYASGATSDLRASAVVTDALSRGTMLLSSDTTGVQTTSFAIPSYAPGTQTPRQAWTAVDSYHDWLKQIDVNRRPIYQAKPSRPIYEIGPWSAIDDDDASANSGDEIFNRVDVTAQTPDGTSLAKRTAQAATTFDYAASVQPINPSFDTNLTGWTGDAISRSTTVFDTTPASLLMTSATIPGAFAKTSSWVGAWEEGVQYKLRMRIRREYASAFLFNIEVRLGGPTNALTDAVVMSGLPVGQFVSYESLVFTVPGNVTPELVLTVPSGGAPATGTALLYVDAVQFIVSKPTLVDRRGFRKTMQLPVNSTLPTDGVAASQIGTVWLTDHKTTPFRGSLNLVGDQSLRSITNGSDVGLEQLLLNTGQLIRFSDRSDPDTGGHGRDGRIAAVSYTPASNSASVTIDNSRTSFDALLSRLAIIQGG